MRCFLNVALEVRPVFDNLAATFYNNVVAAYDEYIVHRDSSAAGRDRHLRTAVTAATALYHFREHLPDSLRALGKDIELNSPDYELIRGVTNASKHKEATRRRRLVERAEDIREVTVIVSYSDENGDYSHAQTKVDVSCTDSTTRWLDPAITRVLNLWGAILKDAGVCGYNARPEPEAPGRRYIVRDQASVQLSLEMMRDLNFRQSMQLLKFDNTLGRALPIDLTAADIQFRVYEPLQHIVDVKMSHPDHGEITASIPLTDEENIALHQVASGQGQDAFMERLFQTHRTEIERKFKEQLAANAAILPQSRPR